MIRVVWLGLAFFFIVLEIGHPGLLYFLSMTCGAAGACVVSWYDYSLFAQGITFFAVTIVAIMLLHVFVQKSIHDAKSHRSNIDQLLGKTVRITEVRSDKAGSGKIGGEVWSVKLQGSGELQVGM